MVMSNIISGKGHNPRCGQIKVFISEYFMTSRFHFFGCGKGLTQRLRPDELYSSINSWSFPKLFKIMGFGMGLAIHSIVSLLSDSYFPLRHP